MSAKTPFNLTEAVHKLLTVRMDSSLALKKNYDDWAIKQKISDLKRKRLTNVQKVQLSEHQKYGPDVAVSRFVVGYCRGKVKNERGNWIQRLQSLPSEYSGTYRVTAIQARNAGLLTEGIDNFVDLEYLESLDLSDNPRLDDFACDQLARQFRRSKRLRQVNLSLNPLISVYGLEILFRIPSLKRLIAIETQAADHPEIDLFTLAAEDEKQCEVLVHKSGMRFKNLELSDIRSKTQLLSS